MEIFMMKAFTHAICGGGVCACQPVFVDSFEAPGILELASDEEGDLVSALRIGREHKGDSILLLLHHRGFPSHHHWPRSCQGGISSRGQTHQHCRAVLGQGQFLPSAWRGPPF